MPCFEDEYYLKSQIEILKEGVTLFMNKYRSAGKEAADACAQDELK